MTENFPTVAITHEQACLVDWDAIDDLFGGMKPSEDIDVTSFLNGIRFAGGSVKTLLRVEDGYGHDDIFLLHDGNVLYEDRNCDCVNLTDTPPADVDKFIKSLVTILTA